MKNLAAAVVLLSLLSSGTALSDRAGAAAAPPAASAPNPQTLSITRSGAQPSQQGPAANFTGSVRVTPLFEAKDSSRAAGASVSFEPGARSAWHTHPRGQILIVTAGVGRVQQWGGPIQEIREGDVEVRTLKAGDAVVMPFAYSDGTCAFCHEGLPTSCIHGGFFGSPEVPGAQAEAVRVPLADGTLLALPAGADDALMPSLLTLSDVMGTGHHAALVARVGPCRTVAVVGDGAVGLCGVVAARRLGAERIFILGRHPGRTALAQELGATDVVSERGEEAVERVRELTSTRFPTATRP